MRPLLAGLIEQGFVAGGTFGQKSTYPAYIYFIGGIIKTNVKVKLA